MARERATNETNFSFTCRWLRTAETLPEESYNRVLFVPSGIEASYMGRYDHNHRIFHSGASIFPWEDVRWYAVLPEMDDYPSS